MTVDDSPLLSALAPAWHYSGLAAFAAWLGFDSSRVADFARTIDTWATESQSYFHACFGLC